MKKIIISIALLSLMGFLTMSIALAQQTSFTGGPTDMADIVDLVENVVRWFAAIVIIIAIFMILYAGFMWITAGGDEERSKSARKALTYGVIGIIVALLAWAVVRIIATFLGVGGAEPGF